MTVSLKRLVPDGTAGGRIAGANIRSVSSASAALVARCGLPNTTGRICVSLGNRVYPKSINAVLRCFACENRHCRNSGEEHMISSAAFAAANVAGVESGREDKATGAVDEQFNQYTISGDIPAKCPNRLAERAHLDNLFPFQTEM